MTNKKTLERAISDIEASNAKAAQHRPDLELMLAESKALKARLNALPQEQRRAALDAAGLRHVSAAPEPITPIRYSYRPNASTPGNPPTPATVTAQPLALRMPDWEKWGYMVTCTVWQAVALSLNIEPDLLNEYGPFDPDSQRHPAPFRNRLSIACNRAGEFGIHKGPRDHYTPTHAMPANIPAFALWVRNTFGGDKLPSELLAMIVNNPAPEQEAAPAPVVAALVEADDKSPAGPPTDWRMKIQAEAWEHWLRLRASGCNPSIYSICDWMAKWCIDQNIKGAKGQNPKAGTIRNSILGAGHWTPPTHSVEQAKIYVAQIEQTAQIKVA